MNRYCYICICADFCSVAFGDDDEACDAQLAEIADSSFDDFLEAWIEYTDEYD